MENRRSGKRKKLTNLQKVMIALTKEAARSTTTAKMASKKKQQKVNVVSTNVLSSANAAKEVEIQNEKDSSESKSTLSDKIDFESNSSLVKRKLSESTTVVINVQSSENLEPVPLTAIAESTSSPIVKNKHAETSQSMKVNIDYIRPAVEKNVDATNDENEYDDTCSVLSGILEEDICYTCGKSTINSEEWGSVVLCDGCNGEYHLQCAGLETIPESNFICFKCSKEKNHFKEMDFTVSDFFPVRIVYKYYGSY